MYHVYTIVKFFIDKVYIFIYLSPEGYITEWVGDDR